MPLSTIFQLYRGQSVLLVEETGGPRENHRLAARFVGDFYMGNIICVKFAEIMLPISKSPTNLPLP
jgi:hypothetical protein